MIQVLLYFKYFLMSLTDLTPEGVSPACRIALFCFQRAFPASGILDAGLNMMRLSWIANRFLNFFALFSEKGGLRRGKGEFCRRQAGGSATAHGMNGDVVSPPFLFPYEIILGDTGTFHKRQLGGTAESTSHASLCKRLQRCSRIMLLSGSAFVIIRGSVFSNNSMK